MIIKKNKKVQYLDILPENLDKLSVYKSPS